MNPPDLTGDGKSPPELPSNGKSPPELPANGKTPPSSPRKELQLQGPHPTALKVSQESHKIKKPTLSPSAAAVHHPAAPPETTQHQRRPIVRYEDLRPRTIRVRTERDFKDLVQRLTGLLPGEEPHAGTGNVPPPARVASTEKNERVVQDKGKSVEVGQSRANTLVPIPPAPITRPPIVMMPPPPFSNHFRPSNTFLPRPTGLFSRTLSSAPATQLPIAMMPPPPFSNHFRPSNTFLPRPTGLFSRTLSPAPTIQPPITMMPPPPFSNHFRPRNTFLPRPTDLFPRMLSPARAILPPNSEPLSFNESGSLPGTLPPAMATMPPIALESSSLNEFFNELNDLSAVPSGSLTEFGLELAEMMASPSDLPPGILSPEPVTQTQQNPLCSPPGTLPPATATMPPISPVSSPLSDYYLQVDELLVSPSGLPTGIISPAPVTPAQPSSSGLVSDSMDPPQPSPDQFNPFI